ncbi:hypothetical protein RO3G_07155 [Rhizopus delemar RA 99-880]|uniref:Uncharacterized protein n=1 Tax=Rhizopus delemar (strain RA 99-880 / ATCC MYA-4621 / FGSC 9543 / NRRL 43880) TaxID=246409 RepID=I1C1X0_RHIO9|nr:hypothetical protein RO3G_07155 [Rhizopus delemar RA 99-880]|eukprot:EIE82450.1 hypothetical protein RO3G_07155 [Rhizopus delemar RA 99-880]
MCESHRATFLIYTQTTTLSTHTPNKFNSLEAYEEQEPWLSKLYSLDSHRKKSMKLVVERIEAEFNPSSLALVRLFSLRP